MLLGACGEKPTTDAPPLFVTEKAASGDHHYINFFIDEIEILGKTQDIIGEGELRVLIIGADTAGNSSGLFCPGDEPIRIKQGDRIKSPCLFGVSFDENSISQGVFLMIFVLDEDQTAIPMDFAYETAANLLGKALGEAISKNILKVSSTSNPYVLATEVLVGFLAGKVKDWFQKADKIGAQGIYLSKEDNWSAGKQRTITSSDGGIKLTYTIIRTDSDGMHSNDNQKEPTTTSNQILDATPTSEPMETFTPDSFPTVKPTLGISIIKVSKVDGATIVYVPAGEFLRGSTSDDFDQIFSMCPGCGRDTIVDQSPQRRILLDAFWIDQAEVTNAQFSKFVEAVNYQTDAEKKGKSWVYIEGKGYITKQGANWRHPIGPGSYYKNQLPVVHVSWNDAVAYCSWAGRRLPTEAEWEKAARGVGGAFFPWGNQLPNSGYLNYNYQIGSPAVVGTYNQGASIYGVFDMAGNVWEWVNDFYDEDYYSRAPNRNPPGPNNGEGHVLRGGSWASSHYNEMVNVMVTFRLWNFADTHSDLVGFRCAMDDKP